MKLRLAVPALVALVLAVAISCGGGKKKAGTDAPGSTADAAFPCGVFGSACAGNAQCCSGVCDPTGACTANPTTCGSAGTSCSAPTDCCSVNCSGNVCSDTQCTSDNGACTSDSECCGGACGSNGTCTGLSATCKTDGNSC